MKRENFNVQSQICFSKDGSMTDGTQQRTCGSYTEHSSLSKPVGYVQQITKSTKKNNKTIFSTVCQQLPTDDKEKNDNHNYDYY